jgi:TP901 family phage tail tape measure protein
MTDSLIIRIGAKADEFTKELDRLKKQTASFEKGLASTAKISAAAFAGLASSVAIATNRFSNFERTFTNVQTLLDKSSFSTKNLSQGISDLRNDVLRLGAESGESFESLNQGLFDLISAGVDAEESTSVLADAVDLAAAGATDTATAVKALTAAVTAYGDEAGDSRDVAEKFFTAQKFGVTTVGALATEFNKVAGLARTLKVGFNEALAAATSLTANGAKPTAQAFTEFRAVLNAVILAQGRLKTESADVQNALSLQNIEQKGIVVALQELQAATGGNVVTLQKLLGSSEALSGALALTGAQAGTFSKILGELNDEQARAAAFNDALATKQETTEKSLARLSRSFEAIAIQLGERFVPLINQVADGLNEIAKRFNSLSDEQKDTIANFIKAGVAISGTIAALSTFGLVVIKAVRFVKTLRTVLLGARIAAAAFTGAFTLGLGTIISFLPEIISGVKTLFGLFSKEEDPKSLEQINMELAKLRKQQEEINNSPAPSEYARQQQLDGVNEEIKALEELKRKQIEAEAGDEGGRLVFAPETDGSDPLAGLDKELTGQQPIQVPIKPVVTQETQDEVNKEAADAVKKGEEEKEKVRSAEDAKALTRARNQNELLKAVEQEKTDQELDFIRRRQELKAAEEQAALTKDKETQALELENIKLKNEQLLAEEQEFFAKKQEEKALQREQDKALQEELQQLDDEQRKLLNEKEIEDLRTQIQTKDQIKQEAAKKEVEADIKRRNQFLKDEIEQGKAVAQINKILNSEAVQTTENAANQLVQLQNSKNKTLKAIGKKAAVAQIAIDTARGAVAAYTSLSGIPLVGPALGAAAAAALIAYGAERTQQVNSAQRGGIVPNALGGSRDRVPMLLEPNELVVPKALAPDFIQAVGRPDTQAQGEDEERSSMVEIGFEDDVADFITAKQRENDRLAIGVA